MESLLTSLKSCSEKEPIKLPVAQNYSVTRIEQNPTNFSEKSVGKYMLDWESRRQISYQDIEPGGGRTDKGRWHGPRGGRTLHQREFVPVRTETTQSGDKRTEVRPGQIRRGDLPSAGTLLLEKQEAPGKGRFPWEAGAAGEKGAAK